MTDATPAPTPTPEPVTVLSTVVSGSDILHRYLASILSTVIVLLGAFVAIPRDAWSFGNPLVGSFIALALTTIVSYLVPLLPAGWQGLVKVGVTIVGGIFAAVWPLLVGGHFDVLVVILAALNALAVQIGVSVRLDNPNLTQGNEVSAKSQAALAA